MCRGGGGQRGECHVAGWPPQQEALKSMANQSYVHSRSAAESPEGIPMINIQKAMICCLLFTGSKARLAVPMYFKKCFL